MSKKDKANGEMMQTDISILGLKIRQSSVQRDLYVFAVDGKTIADQLGVRRMKWHKSTFKAQGFQRPLDLNRVKVIATYLSDNPILPNALVIAFEPGTLEFQPLANQQDPKCQFGTVTLKGKLIKENGETEPVTEIERIGYVIDGQHRLEAIKTSTLSKGQFNVIVSAFHDVPTVFQLQQFYALNQTVPISSGQLALIRREIEYKLPVKEARKKAISDICGILQAYPQSPFAPEKYVGSPPVYKGPLNITVVETMIFHAVSFTHLRFKWQQDAGQIPYVNLEYIAMALYVYWRAVSELFPDYWGKKPKDQRLFCAMGIYAMIRFLELALDQIDINAANAVDRVKSRLEPIKDIPWHKMGDLPSTPKAVFSPAHLFDAINALWQAQGKRPYRLKIDYPVSNVNIIDVVLP